jgi:hypothetical protein
MNNKNQQTEEELDAIYKFLSLFFDTLSEQEKLIWDEILTEIDPEYNDKNIEDDYDNED